MSKRHNPRNALATTLLLVLVATLTVGCADKSPASLLEDIRSLRQEVASGKVVMGWKPDPNSALAKDPLSVFDSLEKTVLAPEVTAYLKDSAGDGTALRQEIAAWPEVENVTLVSKDEARARELEDARAKGLLVVGEGPFFVSLEVHLKDKDWKKADSVAERVRARPNVLQVQTTDKSFVKDTLKMLQDSMAATRG